MPRKKTVTRARKGTQWVRHVAETSNAMDLPPGIFTRPPKEIARGLRQSVLRSRRTKGTKYQSAMSMLNLFINRSGEALAAAVDEEVQHRHGRLIFRSLGATTAQNGLPEASRDLFGRAREDAGRQIHGVGSFCDVANPLRSFACARDGLFPGHDFSLNLATTTRRAWANLRRAPDRPGLIEAQAQRAVGSHLERGPARAHASAAFRPRHHVELRLAVAHGAEPHARVATGIEEFEDGGGVRVGQRQRCASPAVLVDELERRLVAVLHAEDHARPIAFNPHARDGIEDDALPAGVIGHPDDRHVVVIHRDNRARPLLTVVDEQSDLVVRALTEHRADLSALVLEDELLSFDGRSPGRRLAHDDDGDNG